MLSDNSDSEELTLLCASTTAVVMGPVGRRAWHALTGGVEQRRSNADMLLRKELEELVLLCASTWDGSVVVVDAVDSSSAV